MQDSRDKSTPATPSPRSGLRPPLRARLHRYKLTPAEFCLLASCCEHCSDGSQVCASIERLAAFAMLSPDQVRRLIYGYTDKQRTGKHHKGMLERGILNLLAKAKRKKGTWKMTPAVFRINEDALQPNNEVLSYLAAAGQGQLPGFLPQPKAGVAQAPISDEPRPHAARCGMGNESEPHGAAEHPRTVQPSMPHGAIHHAAPCGTYSKALDLDPKAFDPEERGIQNQRALDQSRALDEAYGEEEAYWEAKFHGLSRGPERGEQIARLMLQESGIPISTRDEAVEVLWLYVGLPGNEAFHAGPPPLEEFADCPPPREEFSDASAQRRPIA